MFDILSEYEKILMVCVILSAAGFLLYIARFVMMFLNHKKAKKPSEQSSESQIDLVHYPSNQVTKPYVPKTFTLFGGILFVLVTLLTLLLSLNGTLAFWPTVIISVCFGVAAEVAGSMLKYVIELQIRDDIIFVPQSIGLSGKVVVDIPAAERGLGAVRLQMNGVVTQIQSMSVDEVVLAKGTEVKILYAYSDRIVVVERIVKHKPS